VNEDRAFSEDSIRRNLKEAFVDVKEAVRRTEGRSRAGLMLGLQEIGASLEGFIGAYYPVASNIIVVNKTPLRRIVETNTKLLKPYGVHVLLHEYIHSLGFLDERITQQKTYQISKEQYGEYDLVTQLSTNIKKFFPNLVYPIHGWMPPQHVPVIELVSDFDQSTTNYYIT